MRFGRTRGVKVIVRAAFRPGPIKNKVSNGLLKATRRLAGATRLTAKQDMKRARPRRTGIQNMPPEMQARMRARRRKWHQSGHSYPEPTFLQPSKPGDPPKAVIGTIKKLLFYAREKNRGKYAFIIGPNIFRTNRNNSGKAAKLHERAGVGRSSDPTAPKPARYPKRPFMRPALRKNAKNWRVILKDAYKTSR